MAKELFLFADRIKLIREQLGITQSDLAKKLGLTRSSVNSWEMGLSVPSTPYIIELSKLFSVSADYLLGLERGAVISVDGLSEKEVSVLLDLIRCFKNNKNTDGQQC